MRYTALMVALPFAIVSSYLLWGKCESVFLSLPVSLVVVLLGLF